MLVPILTISQIANPRCGKYALDIAVAKVPCVEMTISPMACTADPVPECLSLKRASLIQASVLIAGPIPVWTAERPGR